MSFERKRIIFDTTALIGVVIKPQSICSEALIIGLEQFDIVASHETLREFIDVVKRDKFNQYASIEEREYIAIEYAKQVLMVEITIESTDCRDPKDNKFLSLALSSGAMIIVSGDSGLLVLNPYKNTEILSIREFVERHRKTTSEYQNKR